MTSPLPDPASAPMGVSVIICAYTLDRWTALQQAVASVMNQRTPVREVVVVIDHNTDLLNLALTRWPHPSPTATASWPSDAASDAALDRAADAASALPSVIVVASTGLRGLSGARNTGLYMAGEEILAFLDDDAWAEDSWIERLLPAYLDPCVVACGGAAVAELACSRPGWWPDEFDWIVGCSYRGLPTTRAVVRNLIGANMSVRQAAALGVGGFAEHMGRVGSRPAGCEETDLFIRLVERWPDARVVYEPAARVHHTVPADRLSWRYFHARCFAEGLSKAQVAARVGRERALASERSYVRSVLPRGVATAVVGAVRGESLAGRRAMAIGAGLAMTTAGYARGRIWGQMRRGSASALSRAPRTAHGRVAA